MADSDLGWCMANALSKQLKNLAVIVEEPEAKSDIIRRRARLLGWSPALSQAACGLFVRYAKGTQAKLRVASICKQADLDPSPNPGLNIYRVRSVNSEDCRTLLRNLRPKVVAVYGTRIIKPATLECIPAPFINYHAGINPKYRGQHPAYWALSDGDRENAGITIHLVDSGVDTGGVLYQRQVHFEREDTLLTYQWVQISSAIPLFLQAIAEARENRMCVIPVDLPSRQYFPPTFGQYLRHGLTVGVW
ncbi:MAG: formyl transferase [Hyphomicrobiaceae bacterium]